ncbi:hypothetical protein TR13x_07620 [Caloranaerobacter sp. TR13]|uniref:membrane lipoprotein lipid attachment site-containing protein n=1 Tax=Caloranaerobacter sp. TR13 TaxID=1302151 RepID=UPI0006D48439|nr:membrane lipoprotein lipid attachment site-containing protein [Caloranaerobacter sp. TR13]KPU26982.1 hypothetical protein TR13x_07620 [Caloranaerobacter sp. TR13]
MKKILLILFAFITLSGCSYKTEMEISSKNETDIAVEKTIDFTVEKSSLTKGFQTILPQVEILNSDNSPKILVNLGVVECADIIVDKVTLFNNEIIIYTTRVLSTENNDIVVPQLIIRFDNMDVSELNNKSFKIVGTNYKPINLTFNKNEILSKIYAELKITPSSTPKVFLVKENNKLIWKVYLDNVFDRTLSDNLLANLTVKVDSDTGKIIHLNKKIISKYYGEGKILDLSNKLLIYSESNTSENNNEPYQSLNIYDLKTNTSNKIYSTHNIIKTAKINSNSNYIAVIENTEKFSELILINLKNNIIQKIQNTDFSNIDNIIWKDNKLYFSCTSENQNSSIYLYDIKSNQTNKIIETDKKISDFDIYNNNLIFTEFNNNTKNFNIYLKTENELKKVSEGFSIKFIDKYHIAFLKHDEKYGRNTLNLLDLVNGNIDSLNDFDIEKYSILNKNQIILLVRKIIDTEFSLYMYNISDKSYEKISDTISKNTFYNSNVKRIFIDINPSFHSGVNSKIYAIDLEN